MLRRKSYEHQALPFDSSLKGQQQKHFSDREADHYMNSNQYRLEADAHDSKHRNQAHLPCITTSLTSHHEATSNHQNVDS